MRITGFTGAVKKDVPMVILEADTSSAIGSDSQFYSDEMIDIRKYRYLICYLELSNGIKMFDIVKLPDDWVLKREFEGLCTDQRFSVFSRKMELCFYWELYSKTPTLGVPGGCSDVSLRFTGSGSSEPLYPTETVIDENGNYVSGSVFMLI